MMIMTHHQDDAPCSCDIFSPPELCIPCLCRLPGKETGAPGVFLFQEIIYLSGRAEHVATPGPWHRFLCLLRDGWWGRNTLLSAHHIPPLRCTGLRRGGGRWNTWTTLNLTQKLVFLLSWYNPLQYDKNWLCKNWHFSYILWHLSAWHIYVFTFIQDINNSNFR